MADSIKVVLEFALLAVTSVFFLVDPFAVIPLFLAVTANAPASERRAVARRSAFTCAIVLCSFALAGPGAISTVMVLVGESHSLWQHAVIYATILLTSFLSFMILAGADGVRKYLGETGIRILMRLMGLLLVALAVQFVVNGLTDFGLLKPLATPY